MSKRALHSLLLLFLAALILNANPANGDPRLEKLYAQFISPCCWKENLLAHHSPTADELRAEIKQHIAAGKTDDEIKEAFVAKYSMRILSLPEGVRGQWLAWTPIAAIAAGLCVLLLAIRRLRRQPMIEPALKTANLPDVDFDWDSDPAQRSAK